jgi:hypothetical protein
MQAAPVIDVNDVDADHGIVGAVDDAVAPAPGGAQAGQVAAEHSAKLGRIIGQRALPPSNERPRSTLRTPSISRQPPESGDELDGIVTHDDRMAAAADLYGVAVIAPS